MPIEGTIVLGNDSIERYNIKNFVRIYDGACCRDGMLVGVSHCM